MLYLAFHLIMEQGDYAEVVCAWQRPPFLEMFFFFFCLLAVKLWRFCQYLFGSVHQSLKDAPEVYSSYIVTLYVPLIEHMQKCYLRWKLEKRDINRFASLDTCINSVIPLFFFFFPLVSLCGLVYGNFSI